MAALALDAWFPIVLEGDEGEGEGGQTQINKRDDGGVFLTLQRIRWNEMSSSGGSLFSFLLSSSLQFLYDFSVFFD
jgi:hypothetical protein